MDYDFGHFLRRLENVYENALRKLKVGKPQMQYLLFIFPWLRGLAGSRKSFVYGLRDLNEERVYLDHPVLGPRLLECCEAVLTHKDKTADEIFGEKQAANLQSSMTLFSLVSGENSIFQKVLEQFFDGEADPVTSGLADRRIVDISYRKYLIAVDL